MPTINKITISLENCYGINKLDYVFDFDETKSYAVYAPNGTMKTSFAKTLSDYSKKQIPNILPFPEVTPKLSIKNDSQDINPADIFVIKSEITDFNTEKMSTLLVNKELRKKHSEITRLIEEKKSILIEALQKVSGIKNTKASPNALELTFTKDITGSDNISLFFQALNDLKDRVSKSEKQFVNISYAILFNDKTEDIYKTKDFMKNLEKYMDTFDRLMSASAFFKKGVFNHTNADIIAKQLIDNGFFKASHKVSINTANGVKDISTEEDLKNAIETEKEIILTDNDLKKSFEAFSKILQKNADTRELAKYLEMDLSIIEHLKDWQNFKRDIWASFLKEIEVAYNDVIDVNEKAQPDLKQIREQAKKETCKWEVAVKIFKERFCVPFEISIDNKVDVMLSGEETVPTLSFKYVEQFTNRTLSVKKEELYKRLSTGEQRALYILNIIFEIEARKELKTKTLFIFDDIADSFDYKNKYAIIQYLYELNKEYLNSYQIILTHNFDFFRTIVSRLNIHRPYALHPEILKEKIDLEEMPYQRDLFKVWRNELHNDNLKLIASIPFMRNIAEYCGMEEIENKLTALLHINPKNYPKTNEITVKDLEGIIKFVLKNNDDSFVLPNKKNNLNNTDKIKEIIYAVADSDIEHPYFLENKIVLSIAIRLKTEELIMNALKLSEGFDKFQTFALIEKYQEVFKDKNKDILTRVQLITPENIHLNAFMYEPILDTGYESLLNLYNEVKELE